MTENATLKRHAALVDNMAAAVGVDLEQKTMEGHLDPDGIAEAVLRCTGCPDPKACESWLAENAAGAGRPPHWCRNARMLDRLAAGGHG
ncbi:DUF6455 family protein [Roseovarius salinarum]|uniref:DUF6455 family protein n=1 Tax=Roseovarius salinarum TaxID=1981892 RepID=UPI000C345973|nr:DUF6455 family protein [Roseovarius salinarum]